MKTTQIIKTAASVAALGVGIVAIAPALTAKKPEANSVAGVAKMAASAIAKAEAAMAKGKVNVAVDWAERAVAVDPQNASHRFLLAQAYMNAGRFTSAETTFNDVLALNPENSRAALKLVLAKIAQGKSAEAIGVLESHRAGLNAADYGLALALAGDPQAAIDVLETAVRAETANATMRQNLGLAYAMKGRWKEARSIASMDLPSNAVHGRIAEWAMFVQPQAQHDQVASLLKVKAQSDNGQPQALALNVDAAAPALSQIDATETEAKAPVVVADAVSDAVPDTVEENAPVQTAMAPVQTLAQEVVPVADPVYAEMPVAKAADRMIVEEAPVIEADKSPIKLRVVPVRTALKTAVAKSAAPKTMPKTMIVERAGQRTVVTKAKPVRSGQYVVQLGAFSNAKSAANAWKWSNRKVASLANYDARQSSVTVKGGSLYRLAVSGFTTRDQAGRVCAQVRSTGGNCFVRSLTNNEPVRFAARRMPAGTKLAVRKPVKAPARSANVGGIASARKR
jgi:Flp pilus assembly protein TadD